ncbi:MAG: nucleotidyltransferase family protein [Romboutsia sp.]
MNNTQAQFIELLSKSIRSEVTIKKYDDVNWQEILGIAKSHKVEGIIYSVLKKSGLSSEIENESLEELKKIVFNTGVVQIRSINNLETIFECFNNENIPVIVLKGLVVRDFYPQPEQRSMCDVDILIHKEDLERTKELLFGMGYMLDEHEASHHIKLFHRIYPVIEVHWHIVKRDGFNGNIEEFETNIWVNTINVNVEKTQVLSLGYEDLVLHLCMHMASHLASSGFGLRQLGDLVLLVENKGEIINWNIFISNAKKYGFERFSKIIFNVCNKLFDMDIPKEIAYEIDQDKYIDLFINEIVESGVHGKKDMVNSFGNQLAFNFEDKDNNATVGAIKRFLKFIFPPIENMSDKYSYAKKVKLLIPIGWIHHLFNGIFSSDYKAKDKLKFVSSGVGVSVKKNKLLEWLEL